MKLVPSVARDTQRTITWLAAAGMISCTTPLMAQEAKLGDLSWLSGCWVAESGTVRSDEVWMAPEGGLMVGMTRTVRGGTATGYEFILLRVVDGVMTYSAHPSGQTPADFRGTIVSHQRLHVENPDHDFPKRIEYERSAPDSVTASVFAEMGDTRPAFVLRYRRRPCHRRR